MKNRNFLKLFIMAFAMASAFALTSCGDDDPVPSPTPDPTPDPDTTPTVSHFGYGCAFTMDSIAGNASSTLEFFFQVPSLRNTLWGTDDAKQPSLGAFRFGSIWNQSSLKATGTATAHADGGEYTAYRQGNLLVFLDEAGVNKYGFQINESEESEPMTMTLVSVDGQTLDEADRVTYTIDN